MMYENKVRLTPIIDKDNQLITIETKFDGLFKSSYKDIIDLKEKLVRNALIEMGWTPPNE